MIAAAGQGSKSLPAMLPSLLMDKFFHQVHLDLLDLIPVDIAFLVEC